MTATTDELAREVERRAELIAAFIETCAVDDFASPVDEWSLANLAGHVSEFPLTFALQAAQLADAPGTGVHRMPDNEGRLEGLDSASYLTPASAAARIRTMAGEAGALIRGLPADGLDVVGKRLSGDEELTVRVFLQRYVIGHLAMHLEQAREFVNGPLH